MGDDIFGTAIWEYFGGTSEAELLTYLTLQGFDQPFQDSLPLAYLFRSFRDMPPLERLALQLCRGKVLDVGCGAGSHSLYLQKQGLEVTALDSSPGAVATCIKRGIKDVVQLEVLNYRGTNFDTILLLMNGIGLAGRLSRLPSFLGQLKKMLGTNGQILLDSSDIRYMYQDDESSLFHLPEEGPYYGEGEFTMEYKGKKSSKFPWLYLDQQRLKSEAEAVGLQVEFVSHGAHYDYLARLT